jgi:hypothetical protein
MPLKFTWKSIVGVLMSLGGVATQAYQQNATAHPHPTSAFNAVAVVAGAVVIGAERIADAWDNKTTLTAKIAGVVDAVKAEVPAVTKTVQSVSPELAQLRADAEAAVQHAQQLVDRANAAGAAHSAA